MLIWHHISLDPRQCTFIYTAMAMLKAYRCEIFTDIIYDTVRLLEKTHGCLHIIQVTYTDTYIKGMPEHNQEKLDKFINEVRAKHNNTEHALMTKEDAKVKDIPVTAYICLFETDISSTKSATKYSRQDLICRAEKFINDGTEVSACGVS